MGNMHLITGYAGEEHIESNDDRSFHAAYYGTGEYVMDRGQKFAASIISNNKVRVLDGDIMMQGGHIRKKENTYNEVTIENGMQGYMRNDLIGVTYEKDQITGIETSNMVVIKGAFYEGQQGDPQHDPEFVHGDIVDAGAVYNFMPLYRAELENLTLQRLTPLFRTIGTFADSIQEFQEAFDLMLEGQEEEITERLKSIGNVEDLQTEAKDNVVDAINELNSNLTATTFDNNGRIGIPSDSEFVVPNYGYLRLTTQGGTSITVGAYDDILKQYIGFIKSSYDNSNPNTHIASTVFVVPGLRLKVIEEKANGNTRPYAQFININ